MNFFFYVDANLSLQSEPINFAKRTVLEDVTVKIDENEKRKQKKSTIKNPRCHNFVMLFNVR